MGTEKGFLCDALYINAFQQLLLQFMAENKRFMGNGELNFTSSDKVQQYLQQGKDKTSKVQANTKVYTAITFNNQFFLKVYRRIDKGIHPDVEVTSYLSEATSGITTTLSGGIEWTTSGNTYNLAMLEKLEENHGDGHHYMLDRVSNFIERILARDRSVTSSYKTKGSFSTPVSFDELDDELREFIGGNAAEVARVA